MEKAQRGVEYDYVIVGAGSAGCVLANRLSADPDVSVLLLEAGPPDRHPMIRSPVGGRRIIPDPRYNWGFETEPEPNLDGRRIPWPRGRTLGGSSAINGMIYIRGHARDYDLWRQQGLAGWSYADVLPFFRASEANARGADDFHGADGPLAVTDPANDHPLFDAFVAAGLEAGYRENPDFNGAEQEGVGRFQFTIRNARRHSTASAFLRPARGRANLTVETGALVARIAIVRDGRDGLRATGVDYAVRGRARTARAAREVILAAGAIGSPQILMLSGVGPADTLRALGIGAMLDRPAVGSNLQDHLCVHTVHASAIPTLTDALARLERGAYAVARAFATGKGPAAGFPLAGGAFLRTDPALELPDVQLHFAAGNLLALIRRPFEAAAADLTRPDAFMAHVCQLRPESRGTVSLRSADPAAAPAIRANYLATAHDRRTMREGFRAMRDILSQPAMARHSRGEIHPGPDVRTDAEIDAFVRRAAGTVYHPVGTCRMGADADAVVDAALRVVGVAGLRVADASVMPTIPGGNTNAPVIMIAEKAAATIAAGG